MTAADVAAQGGDGALRGSVKDSQGGALPGVTVTATSPVLFSPSVAIQPPGGEPVLQSTDLQNVHEPANAAGGNAADRHSVLEGPWRNLELRIWNVEFVNPPHRGPHTVSPIVYDTVPNFGKAALPRTYAFMDQKTAIQMNDVDIDHRGLAYASDRVGTGLFILEYAGAKKRQGTN